MPDGKNNAACKTDWTTNGLTVVWTEPKHWSTTTQKGTPLYHVYRKHMESSDPNWTTMKVTVSHIRIAADFTWKIHSGLRYHARDYHKSQPQVTVRISVADYLRICSKISNCGFQIIFYSYLRKSAANSHQNTHDLVEIWSELLWIVSTVLTHLNVP